MTLDISFTMTLLKLIWLTILLPNLLAQHAMSQNPKTPMYYGWFFDEDIAELLKDITDDHLMKLYEHVEEVEIFLNNLSTNAQITDPLKYYTKPLDPNTQNYDKFFHITAFYCGTNNCDDYSRLVNQFLSKNYTSNLVGLYFTPRTYGIRVNLTRSQKEIFQIGESNNYISDGYYRENEELCNLYTNDANEIQYCPQDENNFKPTDTRAHITLGCAPNVSAVTTGLDLLDILKWELEPTKFCKIIPTKLGVLLQMGDDCSTFVHYLKERMVANSIFNAYYNNASGMLEAQIWWRKFILLTPIFVLIAKL